MRTQLRNLSLLAASLIAGQAASIAAPIGTAISYQGFLSDGSGAAAGPFDFQFKLMTAETGGVLSGSPIERDNVAVRPGDQIGAYTPLTPRQKLAPVPYALNLALPYLATETSPVSLLGLTQIGTGPVIGAINQGTGTGIQANILNAANGSPALAGTTNGGGNAIFGQNSGAGSAAYLRNNNAGNALPAVQSTTNGLGPAGLFSITQIDNVAATVEATTNGNGSAGSFKIVNAGSTASALYAQTNGAGSAVEGVNVNVTGTAAEFSNTNAQSPHPALSASNNGAGAAIYAKSAKGRAAFLENTTAANNSDVLRVNNNGGGAAVFGSSTGSGAGVRGGSTGSGPALMAVANISGTALELGGGGIKVTNAGINSPTPVFIHAVTDQNRWGGDGSGTYIDHPMCNNTPNAILIITIHNTWGQPNTTTPVALMYGFNGVAKWAVYSVDGETLAFGSKFNVMVVKP